MRIKCWLYKFVSILNTKSYKSSVELLSYYGFRFYKAYSSGHLEYEDFMLPDHKHCISHVSEFNSNYELILEQWEVFY